MAALMNARASLKAVLPPWKKAGKVAAQASTVFLVLFGLFSKAASSTALRPQRNDAVADGSPQGGMQIGTASHVFFRGPHGSSRFRFV